MLWTPTEYARTRSNIAEYQRQVERRRGRRFDSYEALWRWSVTDLEGFWSSVWEHGQVRAHRPYDCVLADRSMPGAVWFPGAELNYAEHALRRWDDHPAILAESETRAASALSYAALRRQVGSLAASLRRMGVGRGDRVVGCLPNIPEAVVAFLAASSLGAIWASCPPEFGLRSIVERFGQIAPRVLFAVDGYRYKGAPCDRRDAMRELRAQLASLEHAVIVPYLTPDETWLPGAKRWADLIADPAEPQFAPVAFAHPLWVLYSSGTTGLPKAIVQGHGGILLEHLKSLALHLDLTAADRVFWYTTTGWMMWNFLVSGLLLGSTILLYDGHPAHPDPGRLWRFASRARATYLGTSASHIHASMKAGIAPGQAYDLRALRGVGSTGAPLSPDGFRWVYEQVKPDLLLNSFSGGTDLCTGIVGSCPLVPVRAGEISCRQLGAAVAAYDEAGRSVVDEVGELVIEQPMPSMPVGFWNDPDGRRYREAYFERYPGVWRHGDWLRVTPCGSCVIYGRSDATLNRGGVRMGTAEFYRVVDQVPEVMDSLVIDTGALGREGRLLMFLVLRPGAVLDAGLRAAIAERLRCELSPRHVPDEMHAVAELPYTLNGKKVEVPVKRLLGGLPLERAVSLDAIRNPGALRYFVSLASRQQDQAAAGSSAAR